MFVFMFGVRVMMSFAVVTLRVHVKLQAETGGSGRPAGS